MPEKVKTSTAPKAFDAKLIELGIRPGRNFFHGFIGPNDDLFVPNLQMWAAHYASQSTQICRRADAIDDEKTLGRLKEKYEQKYPELVDYLYHQAPRPKGFPNDPIVTAFREQSPMTKIAEEAGFKGNTLSRFVNLYSPRLRDGDPLNWIGRWMIMGEDPPRDLGVVIASMRAIELAQRAWDFGAIALDICKQHGIRKGNFLGKANEAVRSVPLNRRLDYLRWLFGGKWSKLLPIEEDFQRLRSERTLTGQFASAGAAVESKYRWGNNGRHDELSLCTEILNAANSWVAFSPEDSELYQNLFGDIDSLPLKEREPLQRTKETIDRLIDATDLKKSMENVEMTQYRFDYLLAKARGIDGESMVDVLRRYIECRPPFTSYNNRHKVGLIWQKGSGRYAPAMYVVPKHVPEIQIIAGERSKGLSAKIGPLRKALVRTLCRRGNSNDTDAAQLADAIIGEWMFRYAFPFSEDVSYRNWISECRESSSDETIGKNLNAVDEATGRDLDEAMDALADRDVAEVDPIEPHREKRGRRGRPPESLTEEVVAGRFSRTASRIGKTPKNDNAMTAPAQNNVDPPDEELRSSLNAAFETLAKSPSRSVRDEKAARGFKGLKEVADEARARLSRYRPEEVAIQLENMFPDSPFLPRTGKEVLGLAIQFDPTGGDVEVQSRRALIYWARRDAVPVDQIISMVERETGQPFPRKDGKIQMSRIYQDSMEYTKKWGTPRIVRTARNTE